MVRGYYEFKTDDNFVKNNDFKIIADEIVEILEKKNHDYGDKNLTVFGLYGVAVRLCDKVMRLANLSLKEAEVDESIEDTLKDIAGYAILALKLYREGKLAGKGWFDD